MATSKIKKQEIIDLLGSSVVNQKAVVLLSTKETKESLDSAKNTEFRKKTRSNGVIVKVIKNTIISKAFPNIPQELSGQTYVAYAQNGGEADEITVPKIVIKLAVEDYGDNFKVIGAIVNGEFLSEADTKTLSKTPSKKDSMAMMAGALNSLISKIPRLIKEVNSKVARSVSEVSKQKA
jgi:large subunit ribosomal protein L10